MDQQQEQLESIKAIRSMMERSSRFLSLSGLSGVIVGLMAIVGVFIAYAYLGLNIDEPGYYNKIIHPDGSLNNESFQFLLIEMIVLLVIALATAILLSIRNASAKAVPIWDATAKRLVINLVVPLLTGALFCVILLYHGYIKLIIPSTIVFYGLSIYNSSKYTLHDIRSLGLINLFIGLTAAYFVDYALLFWALGFGVLHIVYGLYIYFKYEK
jgi:hypothetical protein